LDCVHEVGHARHIIERGTSAHRQTATYARAVDAGAPGAWFGPVPSSYGLHLVWVRERRPARLPSLDEVRSAVRESLLADRAEAAVREAVRALRDGGSA